MKVQPVEHAPAPGYPDKYAEESRQALAAARPRRWIAAPVAAGLAATVAFGLSGCGDTEYLVDGTMPAPTEMTAVDYATLGEPAAMPVQSQTEAPGGYVAMGETVAAGTRIPLFEFGEGTGSIGCVSVAAPVFLSEEEAFAILSAAFGEAGLELRPDAETLKRAALPAAKIYAGVTEEKLKTKRGDLAADGTLAGLPVEFVSVEDVEAWQADTGWRSSVTVYPVRQSARLLAEKNPGLVVFYDPIGSADYEELWGMQRKSGESDEAYSARHDAVRAKLQDEARAESERLLREQAAAFLQWLSTEGAAP